jgi:N-acetylglucosaminyldiphosphoundecaprenol N-acetyl-beta-D-mannosaminyltransferase
MPTSPTTSGRACAVRLGKLLLQSMDTQDLLTNRGDGLKHIVTVNSEIFVYAHENPAFQDILERTVNTIDGRIVQFLCSLFYGGRQLQKLAGSDFIYNLAEHASLSRERVFLLGADTLANRGTVELLRSRWPELEIEGYSPSFCSNVLDPKWNDEILARIETFRPTHLVVCFGPVKQEMWIAHNGNLLSHVGVRCAYGLGGTLDFVSGRKKRAPKWIQRIGAEWFFRLITERGRLHRTAKMFKMPYFAIRYHKPEIQVMEQLGQPASDLRSA